MFCRLIVNLQICVKFTYANEFDGKQRMLICNEYEDIAVYTNQI